MKYHREVYLEACYRVGQLVGKYKMNPHPQYLLGWKFYASLAKFRYY